MGLQSQRKGETPPLATSPCGGPEGSFSEASLLLPFHLQEKCARRGSQAEGLGHRPWLVSGALVLGSQTSAVAPAPHIP